MIRLGVDLVDIARLELRMQTWPRLVDRLFTPAEQAYCLGKPHPAQHFAARVAAKEATFKALGKGWPGISWTEVEVVSGADRTRPSLLLTGRAAELAGHCTALISMAHDAGIAMAEVLLLDQPPA
ncbi:MAG TPA: 4'-phosphopantetheinyl transferase superfamily protein [Actinomycetota bacterium]|nr:4'-phosphopantetheinyl transferase superfamily protein [Actinomycetota bacterium]